MSMRVEDVSIREVLTHDSKKTVEFEVKTKKGTSYSPAPINKNGIYKVKQLTVEDMVKKFLEIKRHFANNTFDDIVEVDSFLRTIDMSPDFREIGGNLAFAISAAMLKSFAQWENLNVYNYLSKDKKGFPQPLVTMNKNHANFRDFLLFSPEQKIFTKAVMKIANVYREVDTVLRRESMPTMDKILKTLSEFTTKNSLEIGIDFGATSIWNNRRYAYNTGEKMSPQEQLLFVQDIIGSYPVGYIEDPFHEEDFVRFSTLHHRLPTRLVVGNDLYANNFERFRRGIELKASGGITLVPTEMGTISDFMKFVDEAKKNKISTVVSCSDELSVHLAVGLQCDYAKVALTGSAAERVNEFIRVEEKL